MRLSEVLQVSIFLYFGTSFVGSNEIFFSHILVFARNEHSRGPLTDPLIDNYVCLGTSVHFLWVVINSNCLNKTGLPKSLPNISHIVATTHKVPELIDTKNKNITTHDIIHAVRSSDLDKNLDGLILLRLRSAIHTSPPQLIAKLPNERLPANSKTLCKFIIWKIGKNSKNLIQLKPHIKRVMARGSSKTDRISVYTNRSLCESVPGSVLACNGRVQGLAGILVETDCFGLNKHISFVDLAAYKKLFTEYIDDFDWIHRSKISKASCLESAGYVTLVFIHNLYKLL